MNKKYIPYIVAFVVFVALSVFYFAPQYASEQLYQHDIVQYEGSNKDISEHKELYGEDPQWEGRMFGGMPSYFINFSYSGVIPTYMAQAASRSIGEPASFILLAFVSFYIMLLLFGVDPWSALPASLAYGLSTYFFIIIGAGHITKMVAMGLAPLTVGGVYYALRKDRWLGASVTALSAAMLLSANHPQIAYYFVMVIGAMWISELYRAVKKNILPQFATTTAVLALAAVLAVGANSQLLWYSYDSAKETVRAGSELATGESSSSDSKLDLAYATAWSYGKYETFNLFIPNATGGNSSGGFSADGQVAQALTNYNARAMATSLPAYFGDQPMTSGPVYIGAVIMFIFVVIMFLLCGWFKWWIVVITALAIMLAWGHNMMWFTELFYNYFPLYGKFRTVSMILVIVEWTVPFAAALTLYKILNTKIDKQKALQAIKYSLMICGGVALLFLLLGSSFVNFSSVVDSQLPEDVAAAMRSERASLLSSDALRTLCFVVLTACLMYYFVRGKLKNGYFIAALSLLVVIDLLPINLRHLNYDSFEPKRDVLVEPSVADRLILADTSVPAFRVFNMAVSPFNDATTSYYHRSVGGYHGAKLSRYQDLIDNHLSKSNYEVFNMLNTKYFIVASEQGGVQAQINTEANGAAWFVDDVMMVSGARAEIDALSLVDTKTTAVVDGVFESLVGSTVQSDSAAFIDIVDYKVNHLTYNYSSSKDAVAVFSEIYYPKGWTAYIDGVEAPYFRANYVLRAMVLPEGEHTVEFKFEAPLFDALGGVSLASSLIILSGLVISLMLIIRGNGKKGFTQADE